MERTLHQYRKGLEPSRRWRRRCPKKRSSTDCRRATARRRPSAQDKTFESRGARRMAGKDSTQGPFTPPLAFDNRVKVHKGDQGMGRKSFFMRYEEPKEPTEEEAAKNYDDLV